MPDWYSVFKYECEPDGSPKLTRVIGFQASLEDAYNFIQENGEDGEEYTVLPIFSCQRWRKKSYDPYSDRTAE
jgi:hypothetical protein